MSAKLFAYGSLMDPDILKRVIGVEASGFSATLNGYSRHRVREQTYPAIVAAPHSANSSVSGVLYRGLSATTWQQLDEFEGPFYQRQAISVTLSNGNKEDAFAYVVRARHADELEESDWDFEDFLANGKQLFLRTERFTRLRETD